MTTIDEIAPDLFRLSVYVPDFDMQFNHFLVRDDEPLLFHTGLKARFPELHKAGATLIDLVRPRGNGQRVFCGGRCWGRRCGRRRRLGHC